MKTLQKIISVVALAIACSSDAVGEGLLKWSPGVVSLVLAIGNVLGVLGYSPVQISPATARIFGALSTLVAAAMVTHGSGQLGDPAAHVVLFHAVGVVGILLGVAGRLGTQSSPPPAPPPVAPVKS